MEVNCVRCARRTVETNNSGLMSREKQNMPAIYSSPGTRPIYFTLFSLHFSLLFLRAYFPFFLSLSLSLSPLFRFETKQYTRDTYAGTEEPIKPNYSCIRHSRASSFSFFLRDIYVYIFIYRLRQFVNIDTRDKMRSTSLSFFVVHLNNR